MTGSDGGTRRSWRPGSREVMGEGAGDKICPSGHSPSGLLPLTRPCRLPASHEVMTALMC